MGEGIDEAECTQVQTRGSFIVCGRPQHGIIEATSIRNVSTLQLFTVLLRVHQPIPPRSRR